MVRNNFIYPNFIFLLTTQVLYFSRINWKIKQYVTQCLTNIKSIKTVKTVKSYQPHQILTIPTPKMKPNIPVCLLLSISAVFGTTLTYDVVGGVNTYQYTVLTAGNYDFTITGAGGGGGTSTIFVGLSATGTFTGSGGGGSGFVENFSGTLSVNDVIDITVGIGGIGSGVAFNNQSNGRNGGDSIIAINTVEIGRAKGGGGGGGIGTPLTVPQAGNSVTLNNGSVLLGGLPGEICTIPACAGANGYATHSGGGGGAGYYAGAGGGGGGSSTQARKGGKGGKGLLGNGADGTDGTTVVGGSGGTGGSGSGGAGGIGGASFLGRVPGGGGGGGGPNGGYGSDASSSSGSHKGAGQAGQAIGAGGGGQGALGSTGGGAGANGQVVITF